MQHVLRVSTCTNASGTFHYILRETQDSTDICTSTPDNRVSALLGIPAGSILVQYVTSDYSCPTAQVVLLVVLVYFLREMCPYRFDG
jgi:hypothetical protein